MRKIILLIIAFIPLIAFCQSGGVSNYVTKLINAAGTGIRISVVNPIGYINALSNGADNTWLKVSGTNVTWSVLPTASTSVAGVVKVDGTSVTISNGIISAPNTGGGTVVAVTGTSPIVSSGGNSPAISILAASQSQAGSMSSADKIKLDNLWNYTVQSLSGTSPTWNVTLGLGAAITLSGNTVITLSNLVTGMSGTIFITNPSTAYYIKFTGYTADIKGNNLTINSTGILCSGSSKRDSFGWYWNGSSLEIHVALDYTRITW